METTETKLNDERLLRAECAGCLRAMVTMHKLNMKICDAVWQSAEETINRLDAAKHQ